MTYLGDYCNDKTINYINKYVTKIDTDHKGYEPDIFCSSGIGKAYFQNPIIKAKHKFNGKNTIQYYTLSNGQKVNLPIYYRNHLFTQEERDQLWTDCLDKDRTFVRGIELRHISTTNGYNEYIRLLKSQQEENKALGYGDTSKEWQEKEYKVTFDMLNSKTRQKK